MMEKNLTAIINVAENIVAKTYQIKGCLINAKLQKQQDDMVKKTLDEILQMAELISTHGKTSKEQLSKTEKLARDGKLELARLKKENFKLKRKVDDYEAEVTDESFNSLPSSQELLPSSQELLPSSQEDIQQRSKRFLILIWRKRLSLLMKKRNRSLGKKNIEKKMTVIFKSCH